MGRTTICSGVFSRSRLLPTDLLDVWFACEKVIILLPAISCRQQVLMAICSALRSTHSLVVVLPSHAETVRRDQGGGLSNAYGMSVRVGERVGNTTTHDLRRTRRSIRRMMNSSVSGRTGRCTIDGAILPGPTVETLSSKGEQQAIAMIRRNREGRRRRRSLSSGLRQKICSAIVLSRSDSESIMSGNTQIVTLI